MPLATMVPFNLGGFCFAHDEFFRRNHRRIYLPVVRAIVCHVPGGSADRPASSGLLHHDAHTPSQGGGLYHDQEPSRSRACAVFFEEIPHLVDFENDGLPSGGRFRRVFRGKASDPFQHRARTNTEHLPQRVHRDTVTIEEHGQRLLPQGSPAWCGACKLIATAPTEPAPVPLAFPALTTCGCVHCRHAVMLPLPQVL